MSRIGAYGGGYGAYPQRGGLGDADRFRGRDQQLDYDRIQRQQRIEDRVLNKKNEKTIKESSQGIYRGFNTKADISVEESVNLNAIVNSKKIEIAEIDIKIERCHQKKTDLKDLNNLLTDLYQVSNNLRKPPKQVDNAFDYPTTEVTTTEPYPARAEDYIRVEPLPGAAPGEITVYVKQLATNHVISIATKANTEATGINTAVQALVAPSTAATVVSTVSSQITSGEGWDGVPMGTDYPSGLPINPNSQILYIAAVSAKNVPGATLASAQAAVASSYGEMGSVSEGFSALSSIAVTTGGTGATLTAGTYLLFSMPGSYQIAQNINNMLIQASTVLTSINSIVSDPVSSANVTSAISGISGLTYNGSGLPSNNVFAYTIANAAYALGGQPKATVLLAANTAATAAAASQAAQDYMTNTFKEGSAYFDNIFVKSLLSSIQQSAGATSATLASVSSACTIAYNTYISNCTITINNNDLLQTVLDAIEQTKTFSGVTAQAARGGAGSLILKISSINTGIQYRINILNSSYTDVSNTFFGSTISSQSSPQNSEGVISGSAFTDNSLKIYTDDTKFIGIDLIKSNSSIAYAQTITIDTDKAKIFATIKDFAEKYIEILHYLNSLDTITKQPNNQYMAQKNSEISSNLVIKSWSSSIRSLPTKTLGYSDEYPQSLSQVGFLTKFVDDKMQINFDQERLAQILLRDNVHYVRRVFEFNYISSNPALRIVTHSGVYSAINNMRFTINPGVDLSGTSPTPALDTKIQLLKPDTPLSEYNIDAYSVYIAIMALAPGSGTLVQSDVTTAIAGIGSLTYTSGIPNNNTSAQTIAFAAYNATNSGAGVATSIVQTAATAALNTIEVASTEYYSSSSVTYNNINYNLVVCTTSTSSLSGLSFLYNPLVAGSVTVTVAIKQGAASLLYGLSQAAIGSNTYGEGQISQIIQNIDDRVLRSLEIEKISTEKSLNDVKNRVAEKTGKSLNQTGESYERTKIVNNWTDNITNPNRR